MKKNEMRLLVELIKNCSRSDRKLAKVLGTSQPTVTRMRNKLAKEGFIQEFTVIPDFVKMGFEIVAVTLTKTKFNPKLRERLKNRQWKNQTSYFVLGVKAWEKTEYAFP